MTGLILKGLSGRASKPRDIFASQRQSFRLSGPLSSHTSKLEVAHLCIHPGPPVEFSTTSLLRQFNSHGSLKSLGRIRDRLPIFRPHCHGD